MNELFIPASAGNTRRRRRTAPASPDHPRERGEHKATRLTRILPLGSSPRARGTLSATRIQSAKCRIIPASAGNTCWPLERPCDPPDHPRERGEHSARTRIPARRRGSSPRARGTRLGGGDVHAQERIIPASAGNTACSESHPSSYGGSSPRARGTQSRTGRRAGWPRIIPASAGNTRPTSMPAPATTDHPRERGEHDRLVQQEIDPPGSSPRARGTLIEARREFVPARIIPASAGNTFAIFTRAGLPPDHPRERGEHSLYPPLLPIAAGSSPRARGTQSLSAAFANRCRIIPASAGNTHLLHGTVCRCPDHPRERGEHKDGAGYGHFGFGSSPRARGTLSTAAGETDHVRIIPASAGNTAYATRYTRSCRIIPASAGNTPARSPPNRPAPDHPRERGEHPVRRHRLRALFGSSPRARGTRHALDIVIPSSRIIPASAGNTAAMALSALSSSDHPRERGEHPRRGEMPSPATGSSPRARGTRTSSCPDPLAFRIIPASAGNTRSTWRRASITTDHPRERGEHGQRPCHRPRDPGSSPRARGTPLCRSVLSVLPRIIPASAGNTWRHYQCPRPRADHPRERGEHLVVPDVSSENSGSSPRARGTPGGVPRRVRGRRIIPASAGNTRRRSRRTERQPDHPRERGEHDMMANCDPAPNGSSPRARGTLLMMRSA